MHACWEDAYARTAIANTHAMFLQCFRRLCSSTNKYSMNTPMSYPLNFCSFLHSAGVYPSFSIIHLALTAAVRNE